MATLAKRGQTVPTSSPGGAWSGSPSLAGALGDGAPGTNPASYVVWASNVSLGVGFIDISGFDFASTIGASDTITSVTAAIRHTESSTIRFSSINVAVWSGGAAIGTNYNCGLSTLARSDSATVGTITAAQLRSTDFTVRVTGTRTSGTTGSNFNLDYADVTVVYTPAVTGTGRPKVYNGSVFVQKPLKVYMGVGPGWVEKPVNVWTGSVWKRLT